MSGQHSCYSSDELRAFGLGMLDEQSSQEIADHLTLCSQCEETLARFDKTNDPLLQSVRLAAQASSSPSSSGDVIAASSGDVIAASAEDVIVARAADSLMRELRPPANLSLQRYETGDQIRDYRLLEPLGTGGMGTVFRATHTRLDRTVALKMLPPGRLRTDAALARFEREMKAIGRLNHPAIVRATDAGEEGGIHFLAMDFVDGVDIARIVRTMKRLDPGSACEIIRQAAIGLQYAHEQGFIHRDVKPGNLMLELDTSASQPTFRVRILDLGIALFGAASDALDELTTVGQLMGTLDYMAPEQADNSHEVDARADVYGLGATLYKLLTGTAPFETREWRTPLSKMRALATQSAPPLLSRDPRLPEPLAAVVDGMLQRDPELRLRTAADVVAALKDFASDQQLEYVFKRVQAQRVSDSCNSSTPNSEVMRLVKEDLENGTRHISKPDSQDTPHSEPVVRAGSYKGRRWLRFVRWISVAAFCLLAAVIWVRTGTGTLKIESIENAIKVQIRHGSKIVEEQTLWAGENTLTLQSGNYEIVLDGQYDNLEIEGRNVSLTRGGTAIAKIEYIDIDMTEIALPSTIEAANGVPLAESIQSGSSTSTHGLNLLNFLREESIPKFDNPVQAAEFAELLQAYQRQALRIQQLTDQLAAVRSRISGSHPSKVELESKLNMARNEQSQLLYEIRTLTSHSQKIAEVRMLQEIEQEKRQRSTEQATLPVPNGQSDSVPRYEGKTFSEWLVVGRTERSRAMQLKVLSAIRQLLPEDQESQIDATRIILGIISQYPSVGNWVSAGVESGATELGSIHAVSYDTMLQMNHEWIIPECVQWINSRPQPNPTGWLLNVATDAGERNGVQISNAFAESELFRNAMIQAWSERTQDFEGLNWFGGNQLRFLISADSSSGSMPSKELTSLCKMLFTNALSKPNLTRSDVQFATEAFGRLLQTKDVNVISPAYGKLFDAILRQSVTNTASEIGKRDDLRSFETYTRLLLAATRHTHILEAMASEPEMATLKAELEPSLLRHIEFLAEIRKASRERQIQRNPADPSSELMPRLAPLLSFTNGCLIDLLGRLGTPSESILTVIGTPDEAMTSPLLKGPAKYTLTVNNPELPLSLDKTQIPFLDSTIHGLGANQASFLQQMTKQHESLLINARIHTWHRLTGEWPGCNDISWLDDSGKFPAAIELIQYKGKSVSEWLVLAAQPTSTPDEVAEAVFALVEFQRNNSDPTPDLREQLASILDRIFNSPAPWLRQDDQLAVRIDALTAGLSMLIDSNDSGRPAADTVARVIQQFTSGNPECKELMLKALLGHPYRRQTSYSDDVVTGAVSTAVVYDPKAASITAVAVLEHPEFEAAMKRLAETRTNLSESLQAAIRRYHLSALLRGRGFSAEAVTELTEFDNPLRLIALVELTRRGIVLPEIPNPESFLIDKLTSATRFDDFLNTATAFFELRRHLQATDPGYLNRENRVDLWLVLLRPVVAEPNQRVALLRSAENGQTTPTSQRLLLVEMFNQANDIFIQNQTQRDQTSVTLGTVIKTLEGQIQDKSALYSQRLAGNSPKSLVPTVAYPLVCSGEGVLFNDAPEELQEAERQKALQAIRGLVRTM
ncbi:MAG: protein kinase [Planctomyces sp.]|nr:protein kinase [Planctomyces sp.]